MKKTILLIALVLGLSYSSSYAQYKNAIGGRFGLANGLSFKTFNKSNKAFDFILNFQSKNDYDDFQFTALYEIHNPINNADGLRWYYGVGGDIGSRRYKATEEKTMLLGVDGVLGLDYKFRDAPINLALDWKPNFILSPNTEVDGTDIGIYIRFTF